MIIAKNYTCRKKIKFFTPTFNGHLNADTTFAQKICTIKISMFLRHIISIKLVHSLPEY